MAVRDFFAGLASLFLLLAKIILCLMFAVQDRVGERLDRLRHGGRAADQPPALPLLEQG